MWKFLEWLLRRWANQASLSALDVEREDHKSTRAELAQARSVIALQKAEIESLAEWRERELSRLKAESAIFRGRTVLATEIPASNHE